jgi:cytochrome c553
LKTLALTLALLLTGCGREEAAPPQAAPPQLQFERLSADPVRHGERLASILGCRGCHGEALTGEPWGEDAREAILFTSNLRRAVRGYGDAALERAVRGGVRPDGSPLWDMPSEIFTELAPADMAAIVAFLRSLPASGVDHPRPVFGPEGRRAVASGEWKSAPEQVRIGRGKGPPALDGRHDPARYMIRATCSECHGLDLTGHEGHEGQRGPPDLVVAGGYTREQFRHLMRTGLPPDRRDLGLMAQVARGRFVHMTAREIDAVYDYLVARAARPQ